MRLGFDAKRYFHNTTGLGNYSRDTIRILNKAYPELSLTLFNPKPAGNAMLAKYANPSAIREITPTSRLFKWLSSLWRTGPIIRQLKQNKVQVYHGLSNELPIGMQHSGIKSVVTIHDLIFMRYPKWYRWFDRSIYKLKFRYACKIADSIIAISEQTKTDIIDYFGIDPSKIHVIYQGCHPGFQQALSPAYLQEIRAKYNLPAQFILNVGTIEDRKNLLTLLKAIKPLEEVNLLFIGKKKPYAKQVFDYIATNNMSERVKHVSGVNMNDLVAIYRCATLFVYPSVFEGFGIPIIEALFSQVPVITSTGSCFTEAGGPSSVYVDPFDSEALRRAIKSIYNDSETRARMATEGFKFAQKFKDEHIALQLHKHYEVLLS